MIGENLLSLRHLHHKTQEEIAVELGVSRQAVAKWESGTTLPDLRSCTALAALYGVSLDDLVQDNAPSAGLPMPPRGKHLFGTVKVGDKGQIVIPKRARDIFHIQPGSRLVVLGDETQGLALLKEDDLLYLLRGVQKEENSNAEV